MNFAAVVPSTVPACHHPSETGKADVATPGAAPSTPIPHTCHTGRAAQGGRRAGGSVEDRGGKRAPHIPPPLGILGNNSPWSTCAPLSLPPSPLMASNRCAISPNTQQHSCLAICTGAANIAASFTF
ncbi:hypothetical protein SKAU_G00243160 [Synaphobranchus kaupii]|uniref:Uncharacterized protein n=1 Tax=Synaphobranchus kaupii TaxID=118154 RepID=A0A9Q1ITJ7_SYNKA|nr:hypothetical protein SKAU_G00243160 [Synaphobranchus kaupii]